jgi:hypothetical protein
MVRKPTLLPSAAFLKCSNKTDWLQKLDHATFTLVFVLLAFEECSTSAAFLIGMKKTVKQALEPMQIGDAHAFLGRE